MADPVSFDDADREDLVAYLDGELDPARARCLEAKLNQDPAARAEAEALQRTWELLDYLPQAQPSPSFTSRTLERVSALRPALGQPSAVPTRVGPGGWAAAAWAAVVLLAGLVGFSAASRVAAPSAAPVEAATLEELLVRDLRLIENLRLYEHVEDIEFLRALDDPDLFGEDS